MIETVALLKLFGLSSSNQELLEYMNQINVAIDSELSLSDGEYRAYIEKPDDGYCLIFTDEAYFLGKPNQPIGSGTLFFGGVFFHSEGKDGYMQYKGELPFGLSFDDTRESVLNKLGEQSWQRLARDNVRVISDRWDDLDGVPYQLHITYDKEHGRISIISASIPDTPIS